MRITSQLATLAAVVSFILCLIAGLWILVFVGFDTEDPVVTGIGLYFVGKAFFVGPMLLLVSAKKSAAP